MHITADGKKVYDLNGGYEVVAGHSTGELISFDFFRHEEIEAKKNDPEDAVPFVTISVKDFSDRTNQTAVNVRAWEVIMGKFLAQCSHDNATFLNFATETPTLSDGYLNVNRHDEGTYIRFNRIVDNYFTDTSDSSSPA